MALIRLSMEADNLALVMVRAALALANSSSTFSSVVADAARASKYYSRLVADLVRKFS